MAPRIPTAGWQTADRRHRSVPRLSHTNDVEYRRGDFNLARLEPVDDDPFDPEAVAVMIEDHLVGHLPRHVARSYRPIIAEAITGSGGATCLTEIRGGWERAHGDVGLFGVVLSLPRPE